VSKEDVAALLRGEGYPSSILGDDDDVESGRRGEEGEGLAAGQGGRGRGWMVVYSPDKLCPACPSLFNSTEHEIAPRGSGWLEDLRRVRADLPRDQFFFLLGGCVAARRLLARGGCPAARGARRAAAAASSLFAQMPRARLTPSLARSPPALTPLSTHPARRCSAADV